MISEKSIMPDRPGGIAIVTGAAGGMGTAISHAFAREGRPLILSDLNAQKLDALRTALGGHSEVALVAGDVSEAAFSDRLKAVLAGRRIGVLAHAAGISPSMASGKRIFEINFLATRRIVENLLPSMEPGGVAILIASNSGQLIAHPLVDRAVRAALRNRRSLIMAMMLRSPRTAYPLSKRAVQLYAQAMAPAFGKLDARIVSLSPGIIDTEMGRLEDSAGPEMARMIELTPCRRKGLAEEIASVASFLATSGASYINGTDILIDGGTVAGITAAGGPLALRRMERN
jgi:NAD(P)-dependent dehydrogenase (short-subunit alcohol dehydrogenase family)